MLTNPQKKTKLKTLSKIGRAFLHNIVLAFLVAVFLAMAVNAWRTGNFSLSNLSNLFATTDSANPTLSISSQNNGQAARVLGEQNGASAGYASSGNSSDFQRNSFTSTDSKHVNLATVPLTADEIGFHAIEAENIDSNSITSRTIKDHAVLSEDLSRHLTIQYLTVDHDLTVLNILGVKTADISNANLGTINFGTNTIYDGAFTGNWNFGSGNITTTGIISGSFAGAFAPSGDVDMAGNIMTNIGNANTDFTATGGLNLAGNLTAPNVLYSLSGTAHRITVSAGQNPTLDIASDYVGQTSITTLGTITSGTWHGSIIDVAYGGTGINGGTAPNGTLIIGNGSGYTLANLTAGTGVQVVSGAGSITIAGNYTTSGTLLQLSGAAFSLKEGTLTATNLCTYVSGTGLTCATANNSTNWNTAYTNRVDTWNYPLSFSGNTVTLGYNSTNLKLTSNQLNTIQDIATTASPTFSALTLTNALTVANGGTGSSNGSITGTGALTFTAGGSNQNITLTPSGSGYTILNGNVGIGTTNPLALLSIGSTSQLQVNSFGTIAAATGITSTGTITFSGLTTGGIVKAGAGTGTLALATAGTDYIAGGVGANHQIAYFTASGTLTGSDGLWFDGTNVGIGTTNPTAKFQVNDTYSGSIFSTYFSATPDATGNSGWVINKPSTTGTPHTIVWQIDGTPRWAMGIDGVENQDMVLAYAATSDPPYNTADMLRISKTTRKFIFGPEVPKPDTTDGQFTFLVPDSSVISSGIGIRRFSATATTVNDGLRFTKQADADRLWLNWHQGNGTQDWRVGMETYDLNFYSANGTSATPASPGTLVLGLSAAGIVKVGSGPYYSQNLSSL